jgi:hypothetical protein
LLTPLHRLDRLLDAAVKSMQVAQPPGVSAFRGLFIDREQVDRLLSLEPATAQFGGLHELMDENADQPGVEASPLAWLTQSFGLSSFEADVILLAVAPEVDLRYEKIYSYLQDDVTRKRPTVELALNLFCSSVEEKLARRAGFSSDGALFRNRIVQLIPDPNQVEPSSLAHYLKLDDQIKRLLLGQSGLDERLSAFCQLIEPSVNWNDLALNSEIKNAVLRLAQESKASGKALRLYFQGNGGPEKHEAAEALAGVLGTRLLVARIDRLPEGSNYAAGWNLAVREAQLQDAILFISSLDDYRGSDAAIRRRDLLDSARTHAGITILAGTQAWEPHSVAAFSVIPVDFAIPDFHERCARWQSELSRAGSAVEEKALELLAGRFQLMPLQITQAVNTAQANARWRRARAGTFADATNSSGSIPVSLDELCAAARSQCGHELIGLARKIEPRYGWDDLVVPPDTRAQLQEICAHAEYRPVVYGQWGFDRKLSLGKGLNVLFAGPPGTGKTMGAEVMAHELRLDLYRIDLSQIVSKYIGETEKNLDRIFTAAENSNAILFFDEADALFGKRSEVRDSHDRYANIEISYLLQKMEEYVGISILATNLRQNLDEAFVRRLQAIVEFPFPDEEYRRRIWESVFPKQTPLGADVRFDLLAREVRLAGGNIKNIAIAASFCAAANEGTVYLSHLLHAAGREHQKLARSWNPGELLKVANSSPGKSNGRDPASAEARPQTVRS